jgi:hypothetical protein
VQGVFLRLKFGQQAVGRYPRLFVVDLIPDPLAAGNALIDFVALFTHGLTAGTGGSAGYSQSPIIAEGCAVMPGQQSVSLKVSKRLWRDGLRRAP